MQQEKVSIAFCLDDVYVQPATAVIKSINKNSPHQTFHFYIVYTKLSDRSKSLLLNCCSDNSSMEFVESSISVNNVGPKNHVSAAAFMKVELVKLLPDVDKLLYLDGDICLAGDLTPLWLTDITEQYLAAIENPFFTRHKDLELNPESLYFNSGVMLLNLKYMREHNFYGQAHKCITDKPERLMFHDQDVFNIVVNGHFVNLPKVYNFQTFFIRKIHRYNKDEREAIRKDFRNAVIIHYSSGIKPWKKFDPHPYSSTFKHYYAFPLTYNGGLLTSIKEAVRYVYVKFYYRLFLKQGL